MVFDVMFKTRSKAVKVPLWVKTPEGYVSAVYGVAGRVFEPSGLFDRVFGVEGFRVAHRFLGADYPEFTEAGLQAALGAGFKAVELSVYRTRDGVFVGSHDWTTERTAGVRHEIWDTTWETIQSLNQLGGKFMRLEDAVSLLPEDVVLVLDHKTTSSKTSPNSSDTQSEVELFAKLEELFDNPQERVVWKVFAEASSTERAKAHGYKVMCMLYPSTVAGADLGRWDVLGMEWNASQDVWDALTATGKPTIAHIVYTDSQAATAFGRGARGVMRSSLTQV